MKLQYSAVIFFVSAFAAMTCVSEAEDALPETVGWHRALHDTDGKLLPWTTWSDALGREMEWYLNSPLDSHGYPAFVFITFMDECYQHYRTDNIPCTQVGMGIISYLKYWEYKGKSDPRVLDWAKKMGDYLINETLTPDEGVYPRFTRSTGRCTDFPLQTSAQGDAKYGPNVIEPDKGGIAAYALVKLSDATAEQRYLEQAVRNADGLIKNMRPGDAAHAPWPFRVDSITGQYWGERNGNMVFILRLFDELLAKGYAQYQGPRDALWTWIRTYQFTAPEGRDASLWVQFFEDMTEEDNRNSWAPLEMARYLIEKKEALDPEWKQRAEQCINFALTHFAQERPGGATLMTEQDTDMRAWGGACAKLGGVAAMFYAAGGGEKYRELAYRNLNWVTYFIRDDGLPCDQTGEPKVREGGWQEDCHTDVIHNFMDAIAAVPEWAGEHGQVRVRETVKTIAYSASPSAYFNDHAADVARIYDGFFFVAGSWDEGAAAQLGIGPDAPPSVPWRDLVRENLIHLREAGVTENLLGIYFGDSGAWPSPETLLDPAYRETMAARFSAIAQAARELGFRGIAVDVEYPYPRYSLDHPVYTYEGYTAEDLLQAAADEGRAITDAMLDAYPDVVVALLPGAFWNRPISRTFQLAMLKAMAERDAPGGLHLFSERSYCLLDTVSQVAIPREGDCSLYALTGDSGALDYWRKRCTVAPGVWPLHMVETGGKDYPVRPWADEMAELRLQMRILRCVSKRYVWSFSGHPLWHPYTPEVAEQYGLGKDSFDGAEEAVREWRSISTKKERTYDPRLLHLFEAVRAFDRGDLPPAAFCGKLGSPGDWMVLGPLTNPFLDPAFAAPTAMLRPIRSDQPIPGRDGAVRWFPFHNYEPLGHVRIQGIFDWFKTDNASVHLVTNVVAETDVQAYLHLGWDDGIAVWLNDTLVFDRRAYPERGHGLLYRDRYNFEETIPVKIPAGESRLAVTSINQRASWGVNLRLTDENGWPIDTLTFALPDSGLSESP